MRQNTYSGNDGTFKASAAGVPKSFRGPKLGPGGRIFADLGSFEISMSGKDRYGRDHHFPTRNKYGT